MKKYRALKDVDYWCIRAGVVYEEESHYPSFVQFPSTSMIIKPLLQAGIIEEVPERLAVENIKKGDRYWYVAGDGVYHDTWGTSCYDEERLKVGIFYTKAEAEARREQIIAFCKELDAKNE